MITHILLLRVDGSDAELPERTLSTSGVAPGLLTAVLYGIMIITRVKLNPGLAPQTADRVTWGDRFGSFRGTWPVILLIIGVFGGLFGGIFTPTEAGGIGAFLAFIIGFAQRTRSEEHPSELQSLMRISYAVFSLT